MSSPVSSHAVVVATMKWWQDIGVITNSSKDEKMYEGEAHLFIYNVPKEHWDDYTYGSWMGYGVKNDW